MAAVHADGSMLALAPPELRDDDEIVKAAVSSKASSLKFASSDKKSSRDVAFAALKVPLLTSWETVGTGDQRER